MPNFLVFNKARKNKTFIVVDESTNRRIFTTNKLHQAKEFEGRLKARGISASVREE